MKVTDFSEKTSSPPIQKATKVPSARVYAKHLQRKQAVIVAISRILLLAVLLVVWQLISGPLVNPLFISSPLAVLSQFFAWLTDSDHTLWFHTQITLEETLYGLFFGVISGILAGFLFGVQQTLAKILDPFVTAIYSIPKIALAPLFILWFGIDLQMKVIFAAVTVFFLVFFNTLSGVRNVDQDLVDAVRLMGGKKQDIMLKVVVPSAMGYVLTGVHIAIPYALVGAVIGELIASNRGLGYLIDSSATSFNTAGVFAALIVLTIIAAILNGIVNFIDRKTSRWKTSVSIGGKHIP